MALQAIGSVRHTRGGLKQIEVFPQYQDGLTGLVEGEHILVLYWMHELPPEARNVLTAHPMGNRTRPRQGVFMLRSPSRPNPIGITRVRVLKRDGRFLTVEGLDAYDGSPVVDIKWARKQD